jgi:hypothetical protein
MNSRDPRVYYNLLTRVGSEGAYQRHTICIFVLIGLIASSTFFINTYLFYQQQYVCNGHQSSHCDTYVCSLPYSQRKQY